MFFIARTVAAMLTGSCGSYSTTAMRERRDSLMPKGRDAAAHSQFAHVVPCSEERSSGVECEAQQPLALVAVGAKVDELAFRP